MDGSEKVAEEYLACLGFERIMFEPSHRAKSRKTKWRARISNGHARHHPNPA
jgi:hypothetical protein